VDIVEKCFEAETQIRELKDSTLKHMDEFNSRYPQLASTSSGIAAAVKAICKCYRSGGKIMVCGNGGSAADSEHIVGELMKEFILPRTLPPAHIDLMKEVGCEKLAHSLQQGIPAIALTAHTSIATAILNDTDPQVCFAQQVYVYGRPNDLLIALSTSGNSENILNALKVAKAFGLSSIGLSGQKPCLMDEICSISIKVPATQTFKVQEFHLPVYHTICLMAEEELFGQD